MRCEHLFGVREVVPNTDGCEDCLAIGGTWVHLRLCMACGHVGCCDQSPNRHATAHFRAALHPVIRALTPPGDRWLWCFVDQVLEDPDDFELEGADLG